MAVQITYVWSPRDRIEMVHCIVMLPVTVSIRVVCIRTHFSEWTPLVNLWFLFDFEYQSLLCCVHMTFEWYSYPVDHFQ
jgi:hypothetical protein